MVLSGWKDPMVKFAEMITGPSARQLIRQAGISDVSKGPLIILDNACGTGITASLLHETLEDSAKETLELTCGDVSQEMLGVVKQKIIDHNWKGTIAQTIDAQSTGLPKDYFTHVITNMGLMLMPDSQTALNEIFRILRPGGICAFSTWKTAGWVPDVVAALATIPGAPPFPDTEKLMIGVNHGALWHHPSYVEQQLPAHGFEDAKVVTITSLASVDSPATYVEMFWRILTGMIYIFWSNEDREKYTGLAKPALLKYMTEKYGEGQRIEWEMTAILATARKP